MLLAKEYSKYIMLILVTAHTCIGGCMVGKVVVLGNAQSMWSITGIQV